MTAFPKLGGRHSAVMPPTMDIGEHGDDDTEELEAELEELDRVSDDSHRAVGTLPEEHVVTATG